MPHFKRRNTLMWMRQLPPQERNAIVELFGILVKYSQIKQHQITLDQKNQPSNISLQHHKSFMRSILGRTIDEQGVLEEVQTPYLQQVWKQRHLSIPLITADLSNEITNLKNLIYKWEKKYSASTSWFSTIYPYTFTGMLHDFFNWTGEAISPKRGEDPEWDSLFNPLVDLIISVILPFSKIIREDYAPTRESLELSITPANIIGTAGLALGLFANAIFGLLSEILNLTIIFLSKFIQSTFFKERINMTRAIIQRPLLRGNPDIFTIWQFTLIFVVTLISLFFEDFNPLKSSITSLGFMHLLQRIFKLFNQEWKLPAEEYSRVEFLINTLGMVLGYYFSPKLFDTIAWPITSIFKTLAAREMMVNMMVQLLSNNSNITNAEFEFPSALLEAWFGPQNFSIFWNSSKPEYTTFYEATCENASSCTIVQADSLLNI